MNVQSSQVIENVHILFSTVQLHTKHRESENWFPLLERTTQVPIHFNRSTICNWRYSISHHVFSFILGVRSSCTVDYCEVQPNYQLSERMVGPLNSPKRNSPIGLYWWSEMDTGLVRPVQSICLEMFQSGDSICVRPQCEGSQYLKEIIWFEMCHLWDGK
jgi:hypothetical protein